MAFVDLAWTPYEPKATNRFLFYLEPAGVPSYIVKAAARPSINLNSMVVDHINIQRKFKGKAEWQPISITLYDPITAEGTAAVFDWLNTHHQSLTGRDGYASEYKKQLQFDALGPDGAVVETWVLEGAFIDSINWGQFDWSSTDPATVEVTLNYDYAVLEYFGVGDDVNRPIIG